MRKIILTLSVFILTFMYNFNVAAQEDEDKKPEKFPKETVEILKDKFNKEMILDTDTLLTADFSVYHKKSQEKGLTYYGIEHGEILLVYSKYLSAKRILKDLSIIEKEIDSEQKRNYLFKMEIELTNYPISIKDLEFAYKNWNIK